MQQHLNINLDGLRKSNNINCKCSRFHEVRLNYIIIPKSIANLKHIV